MFIPKLRDALSKTITFEKSFHFFVFSKNFLKVFWRGSPVSQRASKWAAQQADGSFDRL